MRKERNLTICSKELIKTLIYFDIFQFPLSVEEITERIRLEGVSVDEVQKEIDFLLKENMIYKKDQYYSTNQQYEIEDRGIRFKRAEKYIYIGKKIASKIGKFPYVRGVAITGSTAKMNSYKGSDIDYLIFTAPRRLWVVRTQLLIYRYFINSFAKKMKKSLCFNYFISTDFNFAHKNIFIAYELLTFIPVYNENVIERFALNHSWANDFFPDFKSKASLVNVTSKPKKYKKIIEFLTNNLIGDLFDYLLKHLTQLNQKITIKRKKLIPNNLKNFSEISKDQILRRYFKNSQQIALEMFSNMISEFEAKHNVKL